MLPITATNAIDESVERMFIEISRLSGMSPARECSTSGDCADGKGERVRAPIELRATDAQRPRGATNAAAWHRSAACDVKLKRVDRILVPKNYLCSGPDEPLWLPASFRADHEQICCG